MEPQQPVTDILEYQQKLRPKHAPLWFWRYVPSDCITNGTREATEDSFFRGLRKLAEGDLSYKKKPRNESMKRIETSSPDDRYQPVEPILQATA